MADPIVVAKDLRHGYGATTALDGLSVSVASGELYGLVGPDGAGKTTAMRILAGLVKPGGGTVAIAGLDPLDTGSGVRESLGYMPQRYSLYGDLSVLENLRFFGTLFCLDRSTFDARAKRLLAITRLDRFPDRRADALSGGMYKKLALACALLHEPGVLLLDEPTNGVDPISRAELWDLLYEFAGGGMAVVVSTPYMDEAARCHRVGLVHRGRMLLEGRPDELVRLFEDSVLRVRGGAAIDAALAAQGDAVIAVAPLGGALRVVARRARADAVGDALRAAGGVVEPLRPSFEDLFLSRVRADSHASGS
jgi:ABC-2 type transport system ATP-binding protein